MMMLKSLYKRSKTSLAFELGPEISIENKTPTDKVYLLKPLRDSNNIKNIPKHSKLVIEAMNRPSRYDEGTTDFLLNLMCH